MTGDTSLTGAGPAGADLAGPGPGGRPRRRRADAQRNVDALLDAAKVVFAGSGVDAPAKQIADLAGVGVGTLYRHFPQRSDLVTAVFERAVDGCADAAPALAAAYEPGEALDRWLRRYTEFLGTKRGLAAALHSGDPAFEALPGYFMQRLGPALGALLEAAAASGDIRADVSPEDLLHAVAKLCLPSADKTGADKTSADKTGADKTGAGAAEAVAHSQRMVAILADGLRYGAGRQRP